MEENSKQTTDESTSDGWKTIIVENNRLFYINEEEKRCSWIPPQQCWVTRRGLPYGWEIGRCGDARRYYINHLDKDTVRSLPSPDQALPPRTRSVVIARHSDIGFGFVAGSEKPVLIRSVAEDGPSSGKLYANDQILKINGEDVSDMPQSDVILRIKQYTDELSLEVISNDDVQDVKNKGQKKSSIMSRATRERRRSNPVSVRFAETPVFVQYGGSPPSIPLRRSSLPLIPNALKIFLENGQTRSFLYTPETTARELFVSLCEKIGIKVMDRFSLVLRSSQGVNDSYVMFNEPASQIYTRRNCSSSTWLCKLLLVFAPKDVNHLLKEDPVAFEYFYQQMCSQTVDGRSEIKYETAVKLAALHLQQYAMEDKIYKKGKISVKAIDKEVGSLEPFVPSALINTMQKKDLQRVLTQQIKQTRNLCPPGQKYITPLQAKLQYLKICSEMKLYGGRQFNVVIVDSTDDQKLLSDQKLTSNILVGPNVGLSKITNPRSFAIEQIAEFNQINGLVVTPHTEGKQNLKIFLTNGKSVTFILGPIFETRDLVYLISGYCKDNPENSNLSIHDMTTTGDLDEATSEVPPYLNKHRVVPDTWSYEEVTPEDLQEVDLRHKPKFDGWELYSETNGAPSGSLNGLGHPVCNGFIKTETSPDAAMINDSPSLGRIQEEPTPPASPDEMEELVDGSGMFHTDRVDGPGATRRSSLVHLPEDLNTESNVDDTAETQINTTKVESKPVKIPLATDGEVFVIIDEGVPIPRETVVLPPPKSEDIYIQDKNDASKETPSREASPARSESSVGSVLDTKPRDMLNEGDIFDRLNDIDDIADSSNPMHRISLDISLTSSGESSISSNESSLLDPSSPTKLPTPETTNGRGEEPASSPSPVFVTPSFENHRDMSDHEIMIKENGVIGDDEQNAQETVTVLNGGAHAQVDERTIPQNKNVTLNGDIKTEMSPKSRYSSGYIPITTHPNTPIIVLNNSSDYRTKGARHGDEDMNEGDIRSRSEACDHVLKKLYVQKAKLDSILHWNHSVRTNNEIVTIKRHFMNDRVTVLDECIKQLQLLTPADENKIIELVLRLPYAIGLLTESCTLLYNAQYSMRHCSLALIDTIDKFIDVLITTDAWDLDSRLDLSVEIHKDKCDCVHDSLASLRKIISAL